MRDMFRNFTYDVTTLIKAVQALEDEHALERGQWQVTAKMASVGDLGVPPPGPDGSAEPLPED